MYQIKWSALWFCFIFKLFPQVLSLEIVHFAVPETVKAGEPVTLNCESDGFENDTITRWYYNGRQIYKYDPNDNVPIKIFPITELNIDQSKSSLFNLTIKIKGFENSGEYTCEISTGPPSFSIARRNSTMLVGDLNYRPYMSLEEDKYFPSSQIFHTFGETIKAVCIVDYYPVNVTWIANGKQYENSRFSVYHEFRYRYQHKTISNINITLDNEIMKISKNDSKLLLECKANIFDVYEATNSQEIHVRGYKS